MRQLTQAPLAPTGEPADCPMSGIVSGVAAVQNFFRTVVEIHKVTQFLTNRFHASGGRVFVLGHDEMVIRRTGKPVGTDLVHVFTIEGGKVTAFCEFIDTASVVETDRGQG
jgi:uncharacterized protein